MPASARAMVRGELAVVEFALRSRLSLYGSRMPMKKIVPVLVSTVSLLQLLGITYRRRKREYARTPAESLEARLFVDSLTLRR